MTSMLELIALVLLAAAIPALVTFLHMRLCSKPMPTRVLKPMTITISHQ